MSGESTIACMNASVPQRPSRLRIYAGTAIVVFLMLCALGVASVTSGIPNLAARVEERYVLSMLRSHAQSGEIVRWLNAVHANWHPGAQFTPGEAYGSFHSERCSKACGPVVQIAFDRVYGLCVVSGDVITVVFDAADRVKSWTVTPAVDGC